MPKFLFAARYETEGVRGVVTRGGSARRDAIEKLFRASGGSMEGFYFAFGEIDAYVFGELPDHETAAAVALAVNADARVSVTTHLLLTPEEVDGAARTAIDYHGPGS